MTVQVRLDGVHRMLHDARTHLERLSPSAAYRELLSGGAVLVDTRPAAQRDIYGEVGPGLPVRVVERNVLEWRFDPRSESHLPEAAYDARLIVMCQEGYASSLAAEALQRLGVRRATDLIGGFAAWKDQGLPTW